MTKYEMLIELCKLFNNIGLDLKNEKYQWIF